MKALAVLALVMLQLLPASGAVAKEQEATATRVTRQDDQLLVELNLAADAPEWVFSHSPAMLEGGRRWRTRDWTVLTPDVEITSVDGQDRLRSIDGGPVPRSVLLRVQPNSARVEASYNPVIDFGAGSFALYTGQFDVSPITSETSSSPLRIVWRDLAGPVLVNGERRNAAVTEGEDAYILFGNAGVVEHEALATVLHAQLPQWVSTMILEEAPALIDHYVTRLGGGPTLRPTVMAGWNGATAGMTSMGGSVLPGLIAVSFEGEGLTTPSDDTRFMIRAFLAHESAHFWLGQTVAYATDDDLWITEGGAELMSVRAAKAIDPHFPDAQLIETWINDCRTLSSQGPVALASRRNQPRAHYACGATFALAAEGARRRRDGGDWLDVVADLISANRTDGVVTRKDWLDHFESLADPRSRVIVETLLDQGGTDASALIDELLKRNGVGLSSS